MLYEQFFIGGMLHGQSQQWASYGGQKISCVSVRQEDRREDKIGSVGASQTLGAGNSPGELVKTAPLTENLIQNVWGWA